MTQGGSMSAPILQRSGFEPAGHIHMPVDELKDRPSPRRR